jgi:ABC-type transport system involved in cytochrome c biogenesis permease subunit
MGFDFFESKLKRKLGKDCRESWLTSTRYFEVLVVKLTQTLFLNIFFRKILGKKSKKRKMFEKFFVVIWVVLCVQNINNCFGAFL